MGALGWSRRRDRLGRGRRRRGLCFDLSCGGGGTAISRVMTTRSAGSFCLLASSFESGCGARKSTRQVLDLAPGPVGLFEHVRSSITTERSERIVREILLVFGEPRDCRVAAAMMVVGSRGLLGEISTSKRTRMERRMIRFGGEGDMMISLTASCSYASGSLHDLPIRRPSPLGGFCLRFSAQGG